MTELLKTPLDRLHDAWGGKMAEFAGYRLPLSYAGGGFIGEHLWTREHASLFDVSHMGQTQIGGAEAGAALSRLSPGDVAAIAEGDSKYAVLSNESGGALDDFIVGNDGGRGWFAVFNASRKRGDIAHVQKHLPPSCSLTELADWALIALQGPKAEEAAVSIAPDIARLRFMQTMWFDFEGAACRVSRSGYTGEDGFEFSLPPAVGEEFARRLAAHDEVKPAGLGARDSLRLEAGLCLYGNELGEEIPIIDAGLIWTIPKARRAGGDYLGADSIAKRIADGAEKKLIGLTANGRKVARAGAELFSDAEGGEAIGAVTSGVFSPTLQQPIAMGYVRAEFAAAGGTVFAQVRGERIAQQTAKPPFVAHQYKKGN